jgi:hypothetical protein
MTEPVDKFLPLVRHVVPARRNCDCGLDLRLGKDVLDSLNEIECEHERECVRDFGEQVAAERGECGLASQIQSGSMSCNGQTALDSK